jgi:hypothetical protein
MSPTLSEPSHESSNSSSFEKLNITAASRSSPALDAEKSDNVTAAQQTFAQQRQRFREKIEFSSAWLETKTSAVTDTQSAENTPTVTQMLFAATVSSPPRSAAAAAAIAPALQDSIDPSVPQPAAAAPTRVRRRRSPSGTKDGAAAASSSGGVGRPQVRSHRGSTAPLPPPAYIAGGSPFEWENEPQAGRKMKRAERKVSVSAAAAAGAGGGPEEAAAGRRRSNALVNFLSSVQSSSSWSASSTKMIFASEIAGSNMSTYRKLEGRCSIVGCFNTVLL